MYVDVNIKVITHVQPEHTSYITETIQNTDFKRSTWKYRSQPWHHRTVKNLAGWPSLNWA